MTKDIIIRKITSRKLWVSICGFVSLLVVALGHTESEASQMTALIMAGASVVAYIVGEGLIDASKKDEGEPEAEDLQVIGFHYDADEEEEDDEE